MAIDSDKSAKVLVYGLDDRLANELRNVLAMLSLNLHAYLCYDLDQCLTHLDPTGSQVIFCSFENGMQALLTAISVQGHDVPVIAVSRHADVHRWLDAMEAGASDYCAAPFEPVHLQWILQSNIHSSFKAA